MEYDLFRRLTAVCYLFSISGSFGKGFAEFYAASASGDKAPSLRDKIDSQWNLCDVI